MSGGCDRQPDSERILRSELQAVRVNNEKLSAMFRSERADHASTKAAHQEAERLLDEARQARVEAERRENEARADREHVEDAAKLVRADLDALQAAVRGLTGREGNVAAMIGDLAHVGRVFGDVVSQRADLQAARDTLSTVSAAVDAVRLAWEGEAAENMIAALDAVDRALRGVPAPLIEAPITPVKVAGPWQQYGSPGWRQWRRWSVGLDDDFAASVRVDGRRIAWTAYQNADPEDAAIARSDDWISPPGEDIESGVKDAQNACDAALRAAGWTLQDEAPTANGTATHHAPEEPRDPRWDLGIEERLKHLEAALREQGDRLGVLSAAVESISVHAEALDQRVAGIGNGLDEVRDPSWIRKAIARAVEESGGR